MNVEFSAVMSLISLLADPEAVKAKLVELASTIAAADASKAEAAAAHDELGREREQVAALEKRVRAREVAVGLTEQRIAGDLAEIAKWKREQRESRLVEVAPGLSREPDETPNAPDPIYDRFAAPMAMTPRSPKAARVDNRRPRA